MKTPFDPISAVISDIRKGRMVIVTDDADRENEGDLVMAASKVTANAVNFMAKFGRGLICAPITEERASQLDLQRMVATNREFFKTDFTVSVDATHGISTGISAKDRAATIRVLSDPSAKPGELIQPGHVFPLQSNAGGVLRRSDRVLELVVPPAATAGLSPGTAVLDLVRTDLVPPRHLAFILEIPVVQPVTRGSV